MKIKKHVKRKMALSAVTVVSLMVGFEVGNHTTNNHENQYNKQVSRLIENNNKIWSKENAYRITPQDYQDLALKDFSKIEKSHDFQGQELKTLKLLTYNNCSDYQDAFWTNNTMKEGN